jgi:LacI family transcriptional regulator
VAKPTFLDIARAAGVGTATVERVLNGRGGVSPEKVERVIVAARALDWPGRLPEAHRGISRIDVLLVRPETPFFARLSKAFERIAATLDPSVSVHRTFLDEADPQAIAQRIRAPGMRRAGLIFCVPDHPAIRAALIEVHDAGLPLIQIVTRSCEPAAYVGIDNYAAGRMAALLLARMGAAPGSVVALCHSQIYQVQRDRIQGFSDYLAWHPRDGLEFVHVLFGHDEDALSAEVLHQALNRWPDLVGLYNAGGGNDGLAAVLRRRKRALFFVGHELTEESALALREGIMSVVLDQVPEAQARRAMDLILSRLGLLPLAVDNPPIRFVTITSENI